MRLKFILLAIIILFFAYDVAIDLFTEEQFDSLIEALMFTAATALLVMEIRRTQRITVALKEVQQHNRLLSSQLSELVESKFNGWKLTKIESDTAWLLIKGFSISEISTLRDVREKTVHHQLTSIYSKSDTRNRSDFTSQFIQALFDATRREK